MKHQIINIMLFSILIISSIHVLSSQIETASIELNQSTVIKFDIANASLATSTLENSQTDYDVYFYGFGIWTLIVIDGWANTGDVFFQDDALVKLTNADLNGTVKIEGNSVIEFDNSILSEIIFFGHGSSLKVSNSVIESIKKSQLDETTNNIILINSNIKYVRNYVFVKTGVSEINGLTLAGKAYGLNISIDVLSTIVAGFYEIRLDYSSQFHNLKVEGYANIEYQFYLLQYSPGVANIEINDVLITQPSHFEHIYNLTMTNVDVKYDYSYAIVSLYNSNGTIDSMNDIDPNGNMSKIEITNSLMNIVNSDIANVKVNVAGDVYNPSYINTFNDTLIREDLIWSALSVMKHNNFVINGNLIQTVVVNHPDASWEEYGSGVNIANVIKTTISNENLFSMKYNFRILDGSQITFTTSSINGLTSVNSTVLIYDSNIITADFGYNSTVRIYNSLIENTVKNVGNFLEYSPFKISQNSSFYFYDTTFRTNTFDWNTGHYSNLYFENCFFNTTLFIYTQNLTAVNSYFYSIMNFIGNPGVVNYSFSDTIIDTFQIQTLNTNNIYYWYFTNTSIQYFSGSNLDSVSTLHISMINSEVLWVYEWDWGQVVDLTTINTILNRQVEFLDINYYEDHVHLNWNFPVSIYNSVETGQRTIQRRDSSGGDWSNWVTLETITGSSYIDVTVVEGVYYAYRVLNHYDTDFMIYQKSYEDTYNLFPAKLAYDLEVTLRDDDYRIYIDPSQASIQAHFECRVKTPGTDQSVSFDETTIQYQFFKVGETPSSSINITFQQHFDLSISEIGHYTVLVKVASEKVRFWSDTIQIDFEIYGPSTETSEPTGGDDGDSGFIPGFNFLPLIFSLIVILNFTKKKKSI